MSKTTNITNWLPTTLKEVKNRGWEEPDIILFTGDAYVDHPSFGAAVIGRVLEHEGFKVAIVPQPNWRDDLRDFKKLGKPRLFFGVTAGNMDSMINHYTANLRIRSEDAYTPDGLAGNRPNYAVTVYSNILKEIFPEIPVIIGGIEASLRRLTHYDYWSDKIKPSVLQDSKADLLVYGMGEQAIRTIAQKLNEDIPVTELKDIPQTAYLVTNKTSIPDLKENTIELFSFEESRKSKEKFARNFAATELESNKVHAKRIIEKSGNQYVVVNPPFETTTEKELDAIYDLPFTRLPHMKYTKTIPAFEMIKYSVNIHRGCFGGCSFCTISAHQGKFVASRSEDSILRELEKIAQIPDFKGNISDLGGPSANMYKMAGIKQDICDKCLRPSCIYPGICNNLNTDHSKLLNLYRKARKVTGIKKITIGSGLRHDMLFGKNYEKENLEYLKELILYHVSGRLKVAPEHTSDEVLQIMRKPSFSHFRKLVDIFDALNIKHRLNQQIIPYFISSHPGCKNTHMAELAIETKNLNFHLEQVQDLTPTPMTLSSVMFYTGIDPYTLKPIHIPRTQEEKLSQRKFFFWYKKEYRNKIITDLEKLNRKDLINKLFTK